LEYVFHIADSRFPIADHCTFSKTGQFLGQGRGAFFGGMSPFSGMPALIDHWYFGHKIYPVFKKMIG